MLQLGCWVWCWEERTLYLNLDNCVGSPFSRSSSNCWLSLKMKSSRTGMYEGLYLAMQKWSAFNFSLWRVFTGWPHLQRCSRLSLLRGPKWWNSPLKQLTFVAGCTVLEDLLSFWKEFFTVESCFIFQKCFTAMILALSSTILYCQGKKQDSVHS